MTASNPLTTLPHHKLQAYMLALELVRLVTSIPIGDAHLRRQARKSAASAVLNTAEPERKGPAGCSKHDQLLLGRLPLWLRGQRLRRQ